jgi:DNA-binding PadR family transcriptional regulator
MGYRTDTRALVMAVLTDGPSHGYGISKTIRERSNAALKLGEGQLYPILHELEEIGCVAAEWEMQDGDPPRRIYSLTEKGRKELAARAAKWSEFTNAVGSILPAVPKLEATHE